MKALRIRPVLILMATLAATFPLSISAQSEKANGGERIRIEMPDYYIAGGPMPLRFVVPPLPHVSPKMTGIGVRLSTGGLCWYGVGSIQSKDGKICHDVRIARLWQQGHMLIGARAWCKIPVSGGETVVVSHDLSEFLPSLKPGSYKYTPAVGSKNVRPFVVTAYEVDKKAVFKEGMVQWPTVLSREAVTPMQYWCNVMIGHVNVFGKERHYYIAIGDYRFPEGVGKAAMPEDVRKLLDKGLSAKIGRFIAAPQEFTLSAMQGPSKLNYIRVHDGVTVEKIAGDYKGQLWMLLKRGDTSAALVWDAFKKKSHWVIPWTKMEVCLEKGFFGLGKYHVVFAFRDGKERSYSTFGDLNQELREQEIEAEVQKRLAAELKKSGIKQ